MIFTGPLGLLCLFAVFFYVGLFAIGGGLVVATFMHQILVEKYSLLTSQKFYSMLAISESTPGPIGINLATYCGTELYGPLGGIIATIGELLPAIIIITLISKFFYDFHNKPLVQAAFSGLRPATGGLVLVALANVFTIAILDLQTFTIKWKQAAFYALCLILLFFVKKMHPIFLVFAGAVFGILFL